MKHYLLLALSLLALSQSATLFRLSEAPPELIGFWRLLFAAIMVLPLSLASVGSRSELKTQLTKKSGRWAFLSGFVFFLHLWTYGYAAQNTKIANAVILFALNPLFTALFSSLFFKHKVSRKILTADVLALFGIYFLVSQSMSLSPENVYGDVSAIASGVFYSFYILSGQQARHAFQNKSFMLILFFSAALFFLLPLGINEISLIDWPSNTWLAIAALTISSTLIGHGVFVYLVKFLDINFMSCAKLLEPVLASLVASMIFGEAVTNATWFAFFFTGTAILVLFWPSGRINQRSF